MLPSISEKLKADLFVYLQHPLSCDVVPVSDGLEGNIDYNTLISQSSILMLSMGHRLGFEPEALLRYNSLTSEEVPILGRVLGELVTHTGFYVVASHEDGIDFVVGANKLIQPWDYTSSLQRFYSILGRLNQKNKNNNPPKITLPVSEQSSGYVLD